jgi:hypothetical protein
MHGHDPFFDLTYRKADGGWGFKNRVRRRAGENPGGKKDLSSIRFENRQAGKLHLIDGTGHKFELHINLLITFNGQTIDHKF